MATTIIVQRFLLAPAQLLFILYADDMLLIKLDFILRKFWNSWIEKKTTEIEF